MIRLAYSNQTEALLSDMARRVEEARARVGLYESIHIVVPNPNVEAYVKQGLAERLGIAANLKTSFLATLVRDVLRDAAPDVRVIDRGLLEGQVLSVLLDEQAMAHPELAAARAWLRSAGESTQTMDEHRFQLAMQLARLFDEYAGSRPQMLDAWPKRLVFEETTARTFEVWQRRLWLMVMERLRTREREEEVPYRLLRDVFRGLPARDLRLPTSLFAFGFSYFPQAYDSFFATIAKQSDVDIFTLNPCREFWNDSGTALEDMPLLGRWGKPGREHIARLNELSAHHFDDLSVEATGNTLLSRVQNDILSRSAEPREKVPSDESVVATRAPSMRREAEEVAAQIWDAIASSESSARPLRFHEIGVFVNPTQRDAYVSHLATAFRDNHAIPHHVVDLPLAMESRLVEAATLLLQVPSGRFGRAEIVRVLTHPAVAARYADANVERWVELVDDLAITQGKDRNDLAGTYIETDSLNWDQGIKRIVLGNFMDGGTEAPYVIDGWEYAPLAISAEDRDNAALLGQAARTLVEDSKELLNAVLSMKEWSTRLRLYVRRHLGARNEQEERDLLMCISAIDEIAHVDLGEQRVSFQIARAFALDKLGGLGSRRGPYLEGGVVVSSFFPMRAIPFRLVFALGLGEGTFPTPEKQNPLDLRSYRPEAGDVSPHAQDKYLFLETLLCARDAIRLSYVARNEITGDPLEPSSVVRDLTEFVRARYAHSDSTAPILPLRRYDARNLNNGSRILPQHALDEAFVAKLGDDVRANTGAPARIATVRAGLDAAARARLDSALGIDAKGPAAPTTRSKVRVSIAALRAFLSCPVQGFAKFHFGEAEDEDDVDFRNVETESFEQKGLHRAPFLRSVFVEALTQGVSPATHLERRAARLTHLGQWPVGLFGKAELSRAQTILARWTEELGGVPHVNAHALRSHHVGAVDESDITSVLHPSWTHEQSLEGGANREIEVVGRLSAVDESSSTHFHFVATNSDLKKSLERYKRDAALRLSLENALLTAVTRRPSESTRFVLIAASPTDSSHAFATVKGFSLEEADAWLQDLTSDLLGPAPQHLVPHEVAFDWVKNPDGFVMSDAIRELVDKYLADTRDTEYASFALGPIRRIEELPVADEASLRAKVERRLRPALERRLVER